jgi:hypothetical protein
LKEQWGRFRPLASFALWIAAHALEEGLGKAGGGLPNVAGLVGELTSLTYSFSGGKFQIEAKNQIKKRLGKSPDLADALALTFALPDIPGERGRFGVVVENATEYDPYSKI